jgi:hypothetical protein
MPTRNGTINGETIDLRNETSTPPAGWPATQAWWQVYAMGGNDTVHGSAYNDYIEGGDGNDTLNGYNGNDYLSGGAGTDILNGGNGDDSLYGGADVDNLYGGAGNDWLTGDAGNDYMEGGAGNDVFVGGIGNDTMFGQANDDQFFGDAGLDTMDGGAGNDRLWGGSGNDVYQYDGQGIDYVNDGVTNTGSPRTDATFDTGDRLIVSYSDSEIYFESTAGTNNLVITTVADAADGTISNGVIIQDYFLGGHYVIDILQTANGAYSLPDLIPPSLAA